MLKGISPLIISYLYVTYYALKGSKPTGQLYERDDYKVVASH